MATVESTTMTDHVTGPDARGYPGLSHDAHAQDAHAYGLRHRRRAFVHARDRAAQEASEELEIVVRILRADLFHRHSHPPVEAEQLRGPGRAGPGR
jgi:hypothetical protein